MKAVAHGATAVRDARRERVAIAAIRDSSCRLDVSAREVRLAEAFSDFYAAAAAVFKAPLRLRTVAVSEPARSSYSAAKPNKAPEPTRPLVMPRALSRDLEMKRRTEFRIPARVTPSGRVAHL